MQLIFHKKIFLLKISLASHGDAKNKGIFNSIDLKNSIKTMVISQCLCFLLRLKQQSFLKDDAELILKIVKFIIIIKTKINKK